VTPAFRRLQVSAISAHLADGMSLVVFPLLAASFTSSPLIIGGISAARSLPWLLVSIHVGALIDNRGPARLLFRSNIFRVAIFLALTALVLVGTGVFLTCLTIAAFGVGTLEVVADNSEQTLLPSIVPPDGLPKANARIQLIENVGLNLIGAPLASALAGINLAAPLALIATKYSIAAATLRKLVTGARDASRSAESGDVLAGWRYIRRSRALWTLALTTSLMNLALGGAPAILVLYVKQRLHAPTWTYGLLLTALAVGTIAGSFVVPAALARTSETFMLRFALIAIPLPMLVLALTTQYWVAATTQFVWGALEITWGIVAVSYRQEVVPGQLLGRVNAVYRMMAWGSIPIGGLLTGLLGQVLGIVGAYLSLTVILCAGWLVCPIIRRDVLDSERQTAAVQDSEQTKHTRGEAA
jgi:MFS family permease